jgi:receptor L domain-containing protein
MSENFDTREVSCMICEEKIDANSQIKIFPTCVIIAMSNKDFEEAYCIGIIENQNMRKLTDSELRNILDFYLPYQGQVIIKNAENKR